MKISPLLKSPRVENATSHHVTPPPWGAWGGLFAVIFVQTILRLTRKQDGSPKTSPPIGLVSGFRLGHLLAALLCKLIGRHISEGTVGPELIVVSAPGFDLLRSCRQLLNDESGI